jgi:hypothetical protein
VDKFPTPSEVSEEVSPFFQVTPPYSTCIWGGMPVLAYKEAFRSTRDDHGGATWFMVLPAGSRIKMFTFGAQPCVAEREDR